MRLILLGLMVSFSVFAASGEAYLAKFDQYTMWSENLQRQPSSDFLSFIAEDSPLTNKLRNKWLYRLAEAKDWETYAQYYKESANFDLRCYSLTALYHTGKKEEALKNAKPIWLSGHSQPPACNAVLQFLLREDKERESLITQRISLALQERNLGLARYLLKQLSPPRLQDEALIYTIYRQPTKIANLEIGELHDDFYLYGLKRMVSINMDQAIKYWKHVKTKKLLSEKKQQAFLAHLALYKAMRNHDDTPYWFSLVKPEYYNNVLLDWQIRYALKKHNWRVVERLIRHSDDKDDPSMQYWLARSLEAQGKKEEAKPIYESLSNTRNYYGFLASLRIKKPLSFEHEFTDKDINKLKPYKPFTDEIKRLYESNDTLKASRLLNDFVLELPKDERSVLAYWLAKDLKWYEKSLYLSNNEELNNQLSLRFPLAYQNNVARFSKDYDIPSAFIFAIIRQESTFRESVISHAGAHGLMQLLPKTAQQIAQREKIPYEGKHQLFSVPINLRLGSAYLYHLGRRFNHHPILMAAAYNAGPSQVLHWLKNHPPKQIDIWIETLPWHETRNYLKNVMAFYAVYQYRLNQRSDLSNFLKPF